MISFFVLASWFDRLQVNGHSLERMKDVSSAAKMLNELKDQSDALAAPGGVPVSSSTPPAAGATHLELILSRGAAARPPGNNGNAPRAENVDKKQPLRGPQKCECLRDCQWFAQLYMYTYLPNTQPRG